MNADVPTVQFSDSAFSRTTRLDPHSQGDHTGSEPVQRCGPCVMQHSHHPCVLAGLVWYPDHACDAVIQQAWSERFHRPICELRMSHQLAVYIDHLLIICWQADLRVNFLQISPHVLNIHAGHSACSNS